MKVENKTKKGKSDKSSPDQSYLDRKYFIDLYVYNCPFCNRNNLPYRIIDKFSFDWTEKKKCWGYMVQCSYCEQKSLHLSFSEIHDYINGILRFSVKGGDIDSKIFYSVPTSFFTLDNRIPRVLRELITEAEGCLKMNHLTGASACARKAIYEFTCEQGAEGKDYEGKIKSLKKRYPNSDPELFDILAHIQGMTSDKIHEQSWPKWDSAKLKLMLETMKTVLYDIYVLPEERKQRSLRVLRLKEDLEKDKNR